MAAHPSPFRPSPEHPLHARALELAPAAVHVAGTALLVGEHRGRGALFWIAPGDPLAVALLAAASLSAQERAAIEIPPENDPRASEPPPRPPEGETARQAERLFEAIQRNDPEHARDFFFPREPFRVLKELPTRIATGTCCGGTTSATSRRSTRPCRPSPRVAFRASR